MTGDVRAPRWPVLVAGLCVLVAMAGVALALTVRDSMVIPATSAGYVAGAVLTTAFAATYRSMRNARRSLGRFRPQPGFDRFAGLAVGIGFVLGIANAVLLATELAK